MVRQRAASLVSRMLTTLAALAGIAYAAHYFYTAFRKDRPEFRFRYIILSLEDPHGEIPLEKRLQRVFSDSPVYFMENALTARLKDFLRASPLIKGQRIEGNKYLPGQSSELENLDPRPANEELIARSSLGQDPLASRLAYDNPQLRGLFWADLTKNSETCGGDPNDPGITESISMLPASVLTLDIENISATPARAVILQARRFRDRADSFRLYGAVFPTSTDRVIKEEIRFTIDALPKGEHILVPLALIFQTYSEPGLVSFPLDRKPTETINLGSAETPVLDFYDWRLQDFLNHRMYLGPQYLVDAVSVEGEAFPVRPLEDARFTYADLKGGEYGSCPFVFTYSAARGDWIKEGRVLVNARGRGQEKSETLTLHGFSGDLAIRELEPEITYLDFVAVHVVSLDGANEVCMAKDPRLGTRDGGYLDLRMGSEVRISCVSKGPFTKANLVVTGYYEIASENRPFPRLVR
jgi:hypothetical protein